MRALLIIISIIALIVIIFISLSSHEKMTTIVKNNIDKKPITIEINHFQDAQCGMVIDNLKYVSEVIAPNGDTWFFHDHGNMAKWITNKNLKDSAKIWVHAIDTNRWIDGKKAYYSRNEITPMEFGFGAYEKAQKDRVTFDKMVIYTLRGETMANPKIRKKLLGDK